MRGQASARGCVLRVPPGLHHVVGGGLTVLPGGLHVRRGHLLGGGAHRVNSGALHLTHMLHRAVAGMRDVILEILSDQLTNLIHSVNRASHHHLLTALKVVTPPTKPKAGGRTTAPAGITTPAARLRLSASRVT